MVPIPDRRSQGRVDRAREEAARRLQAIVDRSGIKEAAARARKITDSVRRLLSPAKPPRRND